jgi:hypothetical protein
MPKAARASPRWMRRRRQGRNGGQAGTTTAAEFLM